MSVRDELSRFLHDELCSAAAGCKRYAVAESPHRDYYDLRAQNLIATLEPVIGIANVIPVAREILLELDL